jgi:hypothetical protein
MPQPVPPLLIEAFALAAANCTPAAPIAGGKTNPFPTASQIGVTGGAASLNDGFPPLTMTPISGGGVPPFGVDANGILYLLSANVAALAAGQPYIWSNTLQAAMGGYAVGAVVRQLADANAYWINTTAANSLNPDTGTPGANGWWSTKPLRVSSAPAAGTYNDIVLGGASDYVYDVDCTAGAINFTGFTAQRDGQKLVIRKTDASANALTLQSLTGSAAGHQLQIIAGGLGLPSQYMSITLSWNSTVNAWVQV